MTFPTTFMFKDLLYLNLHKVDSQVWECTFLLIILITIAAKWIDSFEILDEKSMLRIKLSKLKVFNWKFLPIFYQLFITNANSKFILIDSDLQS